MVELTIDGKAVSVPEGSMVMHAAQELGVYVPHFCYHKKLSIAANCRMCLVEVEKAPKALPACATPVTQGMIVHTCSAKAVAAQRAVMEFLLINHPLDCPVCDQGGECQLQDLAVGYGQSASRYNEEKRVIFHKNMGPLISAEEMSRCIQCTRCVRFGQEISGMMELGMINRGEQSQITTFVGQAVKSELSGNMIDICPVGALTSKPFRYQARTWELARRRSISPHDSVGSNLVTQVKNNKVLRVVPYENEAVNECWISDKDRWSYEGLNAEDRLQVPMIKGDDGIWRDSTWEEALTAAAQALQRINEVAGVGQIGALCADYATLEEMGLLGRLIRGLGSEHIDSRLRNSDADLDQALQGVPWLGMPITQLNQLDGVLVIGSQLRNDHPLFTQRLRQAARAGARITLIDSIGDDPWLPLAARITVTPAQIESVLAQVAQAVKAQQDGVEADITDPIQKLASILVSGRKPAVLLGNAAVAAPDAARIAAQAQAISLSLEGSFGFFTSGANTVGSYVAQAVPQNGGMNFAQMMDNPLPAYIVLHAEPADMNDSAKAEQVLSKAFTIALTPYKSSASKWARVMLPVGPFTETSGTYVNAEGRAQSFKGVVAGLGQSRPAWKVLRVLGNVLKLANFDDESSESIRDSILAQSIASKLNNNVRLELPSQDQQATLNAEGALSSESGYFERVADLPIYRSDAIVRRSEALQLATSELAAGLNARSMEALKVAAGEQVKIKSAVGEVVLPVVLDAHLPDNVVRVPLGYEATATLGPAFTQLSVERV